MKEIWPTGVCRFGACDSDTTVFCSLLMLMTRMPASIYQVCHCSVIVRFLTRSTVIHHCLHVFCFSSPCSNSTLCSYSLLFSFFLSFLSSFLSTNDVTNLVDVLLPTLIKSNLIHSTSYHGFQLSILHKILLLHGTLPIFPKYQTFQVPVLFAVERLRYDLIPSLCLLFKLNFPMTHHGLPVPLFLFATPLSLVPKHRKPASLPLAFSFAILCLSITIILTIALPLHLLAISNPDDLLLSRIPSGTCYSCYISISSLRTRPRVSSHLFPTASSYTSASISYLYTSLKHVSYTISSHIQSCISIPFIPHVRCIHLPFDSLFICYVICSFSSIYAYSLWTASHHIITMINRFQCSYCISISFRDLSHLDNPYKSCHHARTPCHQFWRWSFGSP